ncbi:DUF551 domain-containing protein [Escherichia coli]|nr:DUF551 domain-containing protein [Escherichia coli]EFB5765496.1 DUF551 domain-containing protein [Escherichia coli]EGA1145188.1 DUF551 domain-containing protein [Escherichia coli]EGI4728318.1 DUF551 domain-containing protein [Escherichia coli]EGJ1951371.1 DUF551 domain-containing protein [Escherichia coli]
MTTITKERLLTIKQWRETYGPGSNVVLPAEEAEELARIALASLEAEPIGFRCRRNDNLGDWSYVYHREPDDFERKHLVIEGIYAAPPAPVVPEEATPENVEMLSGYVSTYKLTDSERDIAAEIWNACRAAMLQSETVSNSDELPLDYLQGHKDGLEWAAQLAEANHPQTGDWLYDDPIDLARAIRKGPDMPTVQAGNYPVTPDGWISCSERMPDKLIPVMVMYEDGEMWSAMWNGNRWDDGTEYPDPHSVTHWREMPAAPQQEVK